MDHQGYNGEGVGPQGSRSRKFPTRLEDHQLLEGYKGEGVGPQGSLSSPPFFAKLQGTIMQLSSF